MEFKDKLKQLRSEKGISQQALADAIHISRSAVAKWENGLGYPSNESLEFLISYFGVDQHFFDTEEPESVIIQKNHRIQHLKTTLISVLIIIGFIGLFLSVSYFSSVSRNDDMGLARQAADYLGYEELEIIELTQRGDYLAALCMDSDHNWSLCVFDRDDIIKDRWVANGGKKSMNSGEIESWNYGSPEREAVIIFCGGDLPEEIHYYTFQNSGVEYICEVEDQTVLDIFIIVDNSNINGYAVPLNDEKQPVN